MKSSIAPGTCHMTNTNTNTNTAYQSIIFRSIVSVLVEAPSGPSPPESRWERVMEFSGNLGNINYLNLIDHINTKTHDLISSSPPGRAGDGWKTGGDEWIFRCITIMHLDEDHINEFPEECRNLRQAGFLFHLGEDGPKLLFCSHSGSFFIEYVNRVCSDRLSFLECRESVSDDWFDRFKSRKIIRTIHTDATYYSPHYIHSERISRSRIVNPDREGVLDGEICVDVTLAELSSIWCDIRFTCGNVGIEWETPRFDCLMNPDGSVDLKPNSKHGERKILRYYATVIGLIPGAVCGYTEDGTLVRFGEGEKLIQDLTSTSCVGIIVVPEFGMQSLEWCLGFEKLSPSIKEVMIATSEAFDKDSKGIGTISYNQYEAKILSDYVDMVKLCRLEEDQIVFHGKNKLASEISRRTQTPRTTQTHQTHQLPQTLQILGELRSSIEAVGLALRPFQTSHHTPSLPTTSPSTPSPSTSLKSTLESQAASLKSFAASLKSLLKSSIKINELGLADSVEKLALSLKVLALAINTQGSLLMMENETHARTLTSTITTFLSILPTFVSLISTTNTSPRDPSTSPLSPPMRASSVSPIQTPPSTKGVYMSSIALAMGISTSTRAPMQISNGERLLDLTCD